MFQYGLAEVTHSKHFIVVLCTYSYCKLQPSHRTAFRDDTLDVAEDAGAGAGRSGHEKRAGNHKRVRRAELGSRRGESMRLPDMGI